MKYGVLTVCQQKFMKLSLKIKSDSFLKKLPKIGIKLKKQKHTWLSMEK